MLNSPAPALVAVGTRGNYQMASPPEQDGALWAKAIAAATAAFAVIGTGLTAWFKRQEHLDQIVDQRVERLMARYEKRIADLETEVEKLRVSLAHETRENDRLLSRCEHLERELKEKTEQVIAVAAVRADYERIINEAKAQSEGQSRQIGLLLAQFARYQERNTHPIPAPYIQVSGQGAALVESDGTIIEADRGMQALYGGSLVGESVLVTIPPRHHVGHLRGFVAAVESGQVPPHPQRIRMLRCDGSELDVEMTLAAEADGFRARLRTV